jgi:hypothetical protein
VCLKICIVIWEKRALSCRIQVFAVEDTLYGMMFDARHDNLSIGIRQISSATGLSESAAWSTLHENHLYPLQPGDEHLRPRHVSYTRKRTPLNFCSVFCGLMGQQCIQRTWETDSEFIRIWWWCNRSVRNTGVVSLKKRFRFYWRNCLCTCARECVFSLTERTPFCTSRSWQLVWQQLAGQMDFGVEIR